MGWFPVQGFRLVLHKNKMLELSTLKTAWTNKHNNYTVVFSHNPHK